MNTYEKKCRSITMVSRFLPVHMILLLNLVLLFPHTHDAQNLISNPSFENTNDVTDDSLYLSEGNFIGTLDWFSPTLEHPSAFTSDTIEKLRGNLNLYRPHNTTRYALLSSGSSYLLPANSGKTYLQTRLSDSLNKNCYYNLSFYCLPYATDNFGDPTITASWCSPNRLGAYFSKSRIMDSDPNAQFGRPSVYTFINAGISPQVAIPINSFIMDTSRYTKIEGVFKAEGGEQYLTMGNFYSMANTNCKNFRTGQIYSDTSSSFAGYWRSLWGVDDLELIKVRPPDSLLTTSSDTVLCPGDTVWIRAVSNDTSFGVKWEDGTTSSLRAITQPGTYWVELDCGCDLTLVDTIEVKPFDTLPQINVNDTIVCPGEVVNYSFPPVLTYILNGSPTSESFDLAKAGRYMLEVNNGCFSDTYGFNFDIKSVTDLPNLYNLDTSLCEGEVAKYDLADGFLYELNGNSIDPEFTLQEKGNYELVIDNSCEKRSYSFEIDDEGCQTLLFIPNAFTPNNDGLNDCFKVSLVQETSYEIQIFNRWGQLVYQSNNPDSCWDGFFKGALGYGVFTYKIIVDTGVKKQIEYGDVTVLR